MQGLPLLPLLGARLLTPLASCLVILNHTTPFLFLSDVHSNTVRGPLEKHSQGAKGKRKELQRLHYVQSRAVEGAKKGSADLSSFAIRIGGVRAVQGYDSGYVLGIR